MTKAKSELRPVVVTTKHKGVFFGYASDTDGEVIKLERARNCIYWSTGVGGFMGLAECGPTSGCKIGPRASISLRDITAVLEVEEKAEKAWNDAKSIF